MSRRRLYVFDPDRSIYPGFYDVTAQDLLLDHRVRALVDALRAEVGEAEILQEFYPDRTPPKASIDALQPFEQLVEEGQQLKRQFAEGSADMRVFSDAELKTRSR